MKTFLLAIVSAASLIFLVYMVSLIRYRLSETRNHKKFERLFDALPQGIFAPPSAVQVSYIFDAICATWKEKEDGNYLVKELLGFKGFEIEYLKSQGAELIAMKGTKNEPQG